VDLEEQLEQVAIVDLRRVEDDLDGLGMGAVVAVGGVGDVTAGVPDSSRDHARQVANQLLDPPEAASGEDGALGCLGHVCTFRLGVVRWRCGRPGRVPTSLSSTSQCGSPAASLPPSSLLLTIVSPWLCHRDGRALAVGPTRGTPRSLIGLRQSPPASAHTLRWGPVPQSSGADRFQMILS
jgi:hypothetical protein